MKDKILIVDDDALTVELLVDYLGRAGYEMLAAKDAPEGLKICERELPKAVVMDIKMPEMTGLDAVRRLRSGEATKHVPVLLISANSDETMRREAALAGAASFLGKPFSLAQMLAEIRRLVPPATTEGAGH